MLSGGYGMSGAWVLVTLVVVLIVFVFTIQAITKQREHPILTQKDVIEALKQRSNKDKKEV